MQSLKKEFESMTMKESEKLDDFYLRISELVTNIRALGEQLEEARVVKKLLRVVTINFL